MKIDQSLAVMKALADQSRLAIVGSLLERPQYVEEIAQRHDLAPSTVSFHLRKLEKAGLVSSRKEQYYVVFRTNDEIFNTTLREIVSAHPVGWELQDDRMEAYRRKVLDSFFRNGRLEKLPAQHKKRLIVLEQFAQRFESGRRYGEQEVTGLITPLFDDYCAIRRLLVDEGLVRRDGSLYWREGEPGDAAAKVISPSPEAEEPAKVHKGSVRSMIKRMYKQNRPDMGVYQIRNTVNNRIYVGSTTNLEGIRNSRLFQLRMGKVVFSRELQKDLDRFGAESFEFSVLEVLENAETGTKSDRSLASLYVRWLEKLQPFGERGYNSAKAYQRDVNRLINQGDEPG
ncbi:MAG TPA: metalloregulator ArsR/SmtB family transcription factor [Geobacteraceae bacterium]|nr:metalloregulator ArsR/SmtB family transcription factor [Geobacteraceae bacterium]